MLKTLNSSKRHILIVDDEPLVRRSLSELLAHAGYTVSTAADGKEALNLLKGYTADMVITDLKMPGLDGMGLLRQLKSDYPEVPVVLITSYGSIETAVEAMREGAYDYITKPIIDSEIKIIIERLMQQRRIQEENIKLKKQLSEVQKNGFHNIVGKSEKMRKIYALIEAIVNTRATVLIHGESGTGKQLIAHAIHKYNKQEREKPFVEVSCGALTETLLESELFGHVKGAFTGAIKDKPGRFELADGGTIFLDEIDAFSPALQVKLLRVLQDGELERVGDHKTLKVDVRVIAATNQKLPDLIDQGRFRKDLYYRLNIIAIELPPLRDRREDIPLLVEEFINKHLKHISKKITGMSEEAIALLTGYDWPGNVRELENVIERAIILTKGPLITPADFPDIFGLSRPRRTAGGAADSLRLRDALETPEKDLITRALEAAGWNRNTAALALGINRTTLYKKMIKYGLVESSRANARRK